MREPPAEVPSKDVLEEAVDYVVEKGEWISFNGGWSAVSPEDFAGIDLKGCTLSKEPGEPLFILPPGVMNL